MHACLIDPVGPQSVYNYLNHYINYKYIYMLAQNTSFIRCLIIDPKAYFGLIKCGE